MSWSMQLSIDRICAHAISSLTVATDTQTLVLKSAVLVTQTPQDLQFWVQKVTDKSQMVCHC